MKKQVVCTLVAALAVTSLSAFAANPFVDVPSDSWAYQSVVELADAGIIQGVDGQYFQGHRSITRYEAAEMVAKAMAHMDKASVEQRALINKLADEYADELNSLGVRVTNLENRVGNTRVFGDVFVRYRYQNGNKKDDSSWDTRFRIRAQGQVNDRTKVTAGVSTGFRPFASNGAASDESNNPYVDLAKVDYNFGGKNWELSVAAMTSTASAATPTACSTSMPSTAPNCAITTTSWPSPQATANSKTARNPVSTPSTHPRPIPTPSVRPAWKRTTVKSTPSSAAARPLVPKPGSTTTACIRPTTWHRNSSLNT